VNHDKLMAAMARRVSDKRVLRLIRAFLESGVMENGLVSAVEEGTPQGGPLSPLLSNLVLDELDRELERRQHRFVRYADDCNIYVASERAGKRVMQSVAGFIQRRLKLKVNEAKSAVARPQERKFLGFSFTYGANPRRRIAPKALLRCKQKVRELTRRTRGISLQQMTKELASYLRGWKSYFGYCQTPSVLQRLEAWIRRRMRSMIWKQMEAEAGAVCEVAPAPRRRCPRGSNRRQSPWAMAYCQQSGSVLGCSDCLLRCARSSAIAGSCLARPN
jgi:RNA-directed DNA polymerase